MATAIKPYPGPTFANISGGAAPTAATINAVSDQEDLNDISLGYSAGTPAPPAVSWSVYAPNGTADVASTVLSSTTNAAPTLTFYNSTTPLTVNSQSSMSATGSWVIVLTDSVNGNILDTQTFRLGRADGFVKIDLTRTPHLSANGNFTGTSWTSTGATIPQGLSANQISECASQCYRTGYVWGDTVLCEWMVELGSAPTADSQVLVVGGFSNGTGGGSARTSSMRRGVTSQPAADVRYDLIVVNNASIGSNVDADMVRVYGNMFVRAGGQNGNVATRADGSGWVANARETNGADLNPGDTEQIFALIAAGRWTNVAGTPPFAFDFYIRLSPIEA
jgi:hypothetical protein